VVDIRTDTQTSLILRGTAVVFYTGSQTIIKLRGTVSLPPVLERFMLLNL